MGRPPCCDKANVKRGLWTAEEDAKILAYVSKHGTGNWTLVPKKAGLNRCGKSCRLRWTNYLRPDLKHESFSPEEEQLIINLHQLIGSRWSLIAKSLPGRTDNDVKNYWNTKLRKKLMKMGIDPVTHKPIAQIMSDYTTISGGGGGGPHFNLIGNPSMAAYEPNRTFYNLPSWNNLLQTRSCFMNETMSSCSSSTVTSMHLMSSPEPTPFAPFQPQMAAYPPPLGMVPKQEGGGLLVAPVNQSEPSNLSSNGDAFVNALLDEDSRIQSEIGELLDGILDDY